MTDEKIEIVEVKGINPLRNDMFENLPWLIAMAIDVLTDSKPVYAKVEYPLAGE